MARSAGLFTQIMELSEHMFHLILAVHENASEESWLGVNWTFLLMSSERVSEGVSRVDNYLSEVATGLSIVDNGLLRVATGFYQELQHCLFSLSRERCHSSLLWGLPVPQRHVRKPMSSYTMSTTDLVRNNWLSKRKILFFLLKCNPERLNSMKTILKYLLGIFPIIYDKIFKHILYFTSKH